MTTRVLIINQFFLDINPSLTQCGLELTLKRWYLILKSPLLFIFRLLFRRQFLGLNIIYGLNENWVLDSDVCRIDYLGHIYQSTSGWLHILRCAWWCAKVFLGYSCAFADVSFYCATVVSAATNTDQSTRVPVGLHIGSTYLSYIPSISSFRHHHVQTGTMYTIDKTPALEVEMTNRSITSTPVIRIIAHQSRK